MNEMRELGHPWSCKQVPNGMNPIVICERSDLLESVAALTAQNARLRTEASVAQTNWRTLMDERDALEALVTDFAEVIVQDPTGGTHAMRDVLARWYRGNQA